MQHLLGDRLVLKKLHIARQQSHLALPLLRAAQYLEVLALDCRELLCVILVVRGIPVTLFEILLQPRFIIETLAVNSFNFRE